MPVIESAALKSGTRPTDDFSQARNRTVKASLNLKIGAGLVLQPTTKQSVWSAPIALSSLINLPTAGGFEVDHSRSMSRGAAGTEPVRFEFDLDPARICSIAMGSPPNLD